MEGTRETGNVLEGGQGSELQNINNKNCADLMSSVMLSERTEKLSVAIFIAVKFRGTESLALSHTVFSIGL